jgi:glycosyltransferase involved in cell wall biosynthesis
VPVVASAVGGLVDTVVDGVTGAHVPPRRPGLLAAALAGLLADPERRADLGAAGSLRARRRYGWDRIARSTLEVYAGLRTGLPAGVTGVGGAGEATVAGGAVDNRERLMPSPATLPQRGTSQPEVGFARAPAPRSGRWPW